MNTVTLKQLAGVLAALVAIWLGLSFARRTERDTERHFDMPRVDAKTVDQATIMRPTDTVRLAKQGTGWSVNGHPANGTLVDDLVRALVDTTAQSELVAESAASHARLGVDSSKARRVVLRHGDRTLVDLLVGGRGGNYESAYVRKPGENTVYQLSGQLFELAEKQPDDWRDKVVARVEPDSIAMIEVQRGKKSYRLARGDKGGGWSIDGVAADSSAVAGLLDRFRNLEASGFATAAQSDSANFTQPTRVIRVLGKSDRPLVVLSADSISSGFWVRRDGDATIFRFDSWLLNNLSPSDSTLRVQKTR
jgi:hypothetical protein